MVKSNKNNIEKILYYITTMIEEQEIKPSKYNIDLLEKLKDKIESMDKTHQIEVLKILYSNKSKINENKSGVFVNLSFLPENTLTELINYVDFVKAQEDMIELLEHQKTEYENTFFSEKGDKDIALNIVS